MKNELTNLQNIKSKAQNIKLFISDVDGVLTDGRIILGSDGQEFKSFNVQDGKGIKLAQEAGIEVAIITGRESEAVTQRAKELAIEEVHQGIDDKVAIFKEVLAKYNLTTEEVAYIGDDLNDLLFLKEVGLALTVANGVAEVKEVADYITDKHGGQGAVREALELILKLQGVWQQLI
ncbi:MULTISPECIES: KdsC family phosphatase [unclassified Candidatus Frackibacter]|uniref:KdsC family phosphatase n=1 Tax=unclassified Candidatus Frackibacter TaxID=2648818 RepID=UPI0008824082|nr:MULTISPECIES: HAD-IIIA family hydrolase [unclassified Candidatus Frackibacter]SDC09257.1 3-deoxy-D-manno-octulosonate 8-phosphate phosphatase (KDO 8-P phosphatase) [Candidatus Frackibacter sp. WG11]SEM37880.1 3-deoxy-D-manno-octulosonate 8-phosphate phosphatase (KDO 8-P phosphatase) [Candidatus Frackibacter sp. WG12]SFL43350.1 3-deoxy-D-manno-octulosonate 8-phosphate phosphatase (KDO 8-P phosphatase) [Candidatus Frackibacter sp. WG13]